jgi:hypothetical protein
MNLSSINLRFFANIAPLIGGLNKAERALDQTGRKFESIGKGLTKSFTAPVAALGALSVAVFTGFEQQMSKVKAVSGASSEEFNKLKENAEKLGASTIFTAKQVAELQTEFAKLGFTAKEITQVTEATLALAQATDTDLATAAAVAGATLRGFGLDAVETGRVTDVMALSFSRSALDMEKFANSMKYVAPVANAAGVSLEETTAMLAILANAGISGSQAGTSLRRILTDLSGESGTTAEKFDKLAAKGITIGNAMDEVGRTAQSALLVILKNREALPGLTKDFENSEGAALSMSKILGDTLFGSLKALSSASEGAMIQIGELVSVALRPLIDMATKIISSFNNMNPTIKKLVVGFTLATATIGPAILAIGGLIRTFAILKGVMMATNPILLAVGVAVGAIGALMMSQSTAMEGATGELVRHKTEANSLLAVIKDQNTSQDVRNSLIEKFNGKFGAYIGNIDKEKTSIKELGEFQKKFNDELSKKIRIAGKEKVLTREMEKGAQIQADIIDAETRRSEAKQKIAAAEKKLGRPVKMASTANVIKEETQEISRLTAALDAHIASVARLQKELEESDPAAVAAAAAAAELADAQAKAALAAEKAAAAAAAAAAGSNAAAEASKVEAAEIEETRKKYEAFNQTLENQASLREQMTRAFEAELDASARTSMQFLPAMEPLDIEDFIDPQVFIDLPNGFAKMSLAAQDLGANISAAINAAAISFTIGIAEMIGASIAGGRGIQNFGMFALQSLAGLLQTIGEMAIQTGIALLGIQVALKTLNPFVAIAAGVALVALASGIKTSLAKKADGMGGIPALAEGGIATGPTLALIGEGKGPEAVIPLDKLEGMMGGGFGNGQNVVVTGRIQGSDILISSERAERQRSRYRGF